MKLLIDVPDEMIPTKQEIVDIPIHFVDGKVCEVGGYGFTVLKEGYGDLIDRNELLKHDRSVWTKGGWQDVISTEAVEDAETIIEADREDE